MIKFSIVIPVHNVAPWLHECLDSIRRQSFEDWEALCVDDGSTDESGEILDGYAAQDSRIRVWHCMNAGVSVARNFALPRVQGAWILFVDADDVLPDFALACYDAVTSSNVEMISGERIQFPDGGKPQFPRPIDSYHVVEWNEYATEGCHKRSICQGCYRHDVVADMTFLDGVCMGEDREFVSRVYGRVRRFGVLETTVYGYRIRSTSAMQSRMTAKKLIDRVEMTLLVADNLHKANRKTPTAERRFSAFNLTEFVAIDYFRLSPIERKTVRPVWQRAIRSVWVDKTAPVWCRFASLVVLCLPFDIILRILFWIPMALKRKGFHR